MGDLEVKIRLLGDAAMGFDEAQANVWIESRQTLLSDRQPSDTIEIDRGEEAKRLLEQIVNGYEPHRPRRMNAHPRPTRTTV